MSSKAKRITLASIAAVLALLILIPVSYLLYVVFSYYRVEDNVTLDISGDGEGAVPVGESLSLVTYNIGFGAYSQDYSFFMDGGKYSRAYSEEEVIKNTNGAISTVSAQNADFLLFQEVDVDGTRSYHVNQRALLATAFSGYDRVFAQNYDSPYFLYPFNQPIGANKSGIMTFSKYNLISSVRKSLPVENSVYKYLDLDRAYSVSVSETNNGKRLVIFNVHLSAYTSDGTIANEQMKLLAADMKAYIDNGDYVIAAGDFNKDMLGDSSKYFERAEGAYNWAMPFETELLPDGMTSHSGTNAPTCRNADAPYKGDGSDFVLSVDGVLVSSNIEVIKCETVDTDFSNSDHDPVRIEFKLK